MNNPIFKFSLSLIIIVSVIFIIHLGILYFLQLPLFDNLISYTYLVNYLLAVIIFIILFKLQKNHDHLIGFVFMAGSALKFLAYFIIFSPFFKQDGNITTLEKIAFMIPYFTCLIFETTYLVQMLNKK